MADVTMRIWRGNATAATSRTTRSLRTRRKSSSTSFTAFSDRSAGLGLSMELQGGQVRFVLGGDQR